MSASALRKNLWVICAGLSFPLATWAAPILAPADDSFYTPPAVSAGNGPKSALLSIMASLRSGIA